MLINSIWYAISAIYWIEFDEIEGLHRTKWNTKTKFCLIFRTCFPINAAAYSYNLGTDYIRVPVVRVGIHRITYWSALFTIFVTSVKIRQWLSRVTKSRVKSIAASYHKWKNVVIQANPYITVFLALYSLALWCHHSRSMASRKREALTLCRHICRL